MNINDFLIEYKDGLIGIGGTVVGIVISELIKRYGRIKFIKESIDANFYKSKSDSMGGHKELICKNEDANSFKAIIALQIYNGKDIPKVFNKVNFIFRKGTYSKLANVLNLESSKIVAERHDYDVITNIKIEAKSLIELNIKCHINKDIQSLNNTKMYLQYHEVDTNKKREIFLMDLSE